MIKELQESTQQEKPQLEDGFSYGQDNDNPETENKNSSNAQRNLSNDSPSKISQSKTLVLRKKRSLLLQASSQYFEDELFDPAAGEVSEKNKDESPNNRKIVEQMKNSCLQSPINLPKIRKDDVFLDSSRQNEYMCGKTSLQRIKDERKTNLNALSLFLNKRYQSIDLKDSTEKITDACRKSPKSNRYDISMLSKTLDLVKNKSSSIAMQCQVMNSRSYLKPRRLIQNGSSDANQMVQLEKIKPMSQIQDSLRLSSSLQRESKRKFPTLEMQNEGGFTNIVEISKKKSPRKNMQQSGVQMKIDTKRSKPMVSASISEQKSIYFNEEHRKKYFQSVVDKYFIQEGESKASLEKILSSHSSSPTKLSKRHRNYKQISPRKSARENTHYQTLENIQFELLGDHHHGTKILGDFREKLSNDSLNNSCAEFLEEIREEDAKGEYDTTNNFDSKEMEYEFGMNLSSTSIGLNSFTSEYNSPSSQFNNSQVVLSKSSSSVFDEIKQMQRKNDLSRVEEQTKVMKKSKIYENSSLVIVQLKKEIKALSAKGGRLVVYEYRKYFKNQEAMVLKDRQIQVIELIKRAQERDVSQNSSRYFTVFPLWQEDQFQRNCIKLSLNQIIGPSTYQKRSSTPLVLSKLLSKMTHIQETFQKRYILIKPSKDPKCFLTQEKLLKNGHVGLLSLIRSISSQLVSLEGQVINNKVCLNNIIMVDENRYVINEWCCSFTRRHFQTQDGTFQARNQAVLKNSNGEWFASPEYLAPEVLQNALRVDSLRKQQRFDGQNNLTLIAEENDLFAQNRNTSDVWSLGLMTVEILTMIPIWIGENCVVEGKKNPKILPRKGLLSSQKRNVENILKKQLYLKAKLEKRLKIESQPYKISGSVVSMVMRMLELDPAKRITLKEILEELDRIQKSVPRFYK